jgi:hypothetical protein
VAPNLEKNPNLENILKNRAGSMADFAVWDCRIAVRRGEMELGS